MQGHFPSFISIDWRYLFLCLGLIFYGILGAPTPDQPGWIEAIIGLCLFLAIPLKNWQALSSPAFRPENGSFKILFLYGVMIIVPIALLRGNEGALILRDMAALIFLCLPLFITSYKPSSLIPFYALIALAFSARLLGPALDVWPAPEELYYFGISPLVMFMAIYGTGLLFMAAYQQRFSQAALIYGAIGIICLIAMTVDVQRATIGAVFLSLLILGIIGLFRAPKKMILPLLIFCVIFIAAQDVLLSVWHSMALKTSLVGLNMRAAEMYAVFELISGDIWIFLFGTGWGGIFYSPAVDYLPVAFTHSLLTYMALKTGIIGLAISALTMMFVLIKVGRLFFSSPLMSLSLGFSLLIPVFFYASYKSLDFGLILVLTMMVTTNPRDKTIS